MMLLKRQTTVNFNREAQDMCKSSLHAWIAAMLLLIALPPGVHADATAPCNEGSGFNSTECGVNASATATASAALGNGAQSTGSFSTALGRAAEASANNSTATGTAATASAAQGTTFGALSIANSNNTISIGYATGSNGGTLVSDSPGGIAIGYFANISPASPGAIAIGSSDGPIDLSTRGAQATGENAIAIGFEAMADQANSIALGGESIADGEGAIAIGNDVDNNGIGALAQAAGAIAIGADTFNNVAHSMLVGVPTRVVRDDGTTQVLVNEKSAGNNVRTLFNLICDTCTPGFRFNQLLPANQTWNFRMLQSGAFSVDDPTTVPKEAEFRSGGDLKIGGTLIQASSVELKTGIRELEAGEVLSRLEQLPISEWSYRKDLGKVRHIGPMAEDFHELFQLGVDNRSISSLDTSGVALAAIKSLHLVNKQLKADSDEAFVQLAKKDQQIAELQHQIDELKTMLTSMVALNQSRQVEDRF